MHCLLCLALFMPFASTAFLNDGEASHQIVPYFKIANGIKVTISNDMRLDCLLSILDLPQGSTDLIDISPDTTVEQLLHLPKSFYGSLKAWRAINDFNIPQLVLLLLLDDDRYCAFEASLPNSNYMPHWLLGVERRHMASIPPDYNVFPSRRLLRTFKTHFRPVSSICVNFLFSLTYAKASNFIDWSRIFFEEQVERLTDDQIIANPVLRRTILKNLASELSCNLAEADDSFVRLLDCFIFGHDSVPFHVRFEHCIDRLGPSEALESNCYCLLQFHTEIVIRRNELLFQQAFSGNNAIAGHEADFVDSILQLYSGKIFTLEFYSHLEDKIVQYREFFTPALWTALGTELQTRPRCRRISFLALVLASYFLGHVDLLPPFVQAYPFLASLPVGRDSRLDFELAGTPKLIELLGYAIDLATVFDPEIRITNRKLAISFISHKLTCSLSALSYFLTQNQPVPEYFRHRSEKMSFLSVRNPSVMELVFKDLISQKMHLISRRDLAYIVNAAGFKVLNSLDSSTCTWFLDNLLRGPIEFCCWDLVSNIRRHFSSIAANKKPEWAIQLLENGSIYSEWALVQSIYLMVIKHFDLTADLFILLLQFGVDDTAVFVQLFKKIWAVYPHFDCDSNCTFFLRQIRPGLSRWLKARFEITFDKSDKSDRCILRRK